MFFGKKKGIKKIGTLLVLFISAVFFMDLGCKHSSNDNTAALLLLLSANSSRGSVPAPLLAWEKARLGWLSPTPSLPSQSLQDIETGHHSIKVVLSTLGSRNQYLLIENKVKKAGTWTEYLPGDGLLITHIDDEFIDDGALTYNEINSINSPYNYVLHGVEIEEADGNFALWNRTDQGSATDTYYSGNKTSITPYTTPNTAYNNWSGSWPNYTFVGFVSSGVYVDNISAKGDTMTFNVH
jgi:hypothetical protein